MAIINRPIDLLALRTRIDCRRVWQMAGWHYVTARAENWRGPCPVHGSSRPRSTSLSVCARVCRCFTCNYRADGIGVWAWHRSISVLQAAHELCEHFTIPIPYLACR